MVRSRARRFGFRADELPDLEQTIVRELIKAPFDPDAPGASERTFVIAVIDRQLKKVRRDRRRDIRRVNYEAESLEEITYTDMASPALIRLESHEVTLDVRQAVAGLTPVQKDICRALAEGYSQAEIAQRTGRSKTAICEEVKRLRKTFRDLGLAEHIGGTDPRT